MRTPDDWQIANDKTRPERLTREQHGEYAEACKRYAEARRDKAKSVTDGRIKLGAKLRKRIPDAESRVVEGWEHQANLADDKAMMHGIYSTEEGYELLMKYSGVSSDARK